MLEKNSFQNGVVYPVDHLNKNSMISILIPHTKINLKWLND